MYELGDLECDGWTVYEAEEVALRTEQMGSEVELSAKRPLSIASGR